MYVKTSIKVHNMNIECNGIKTTIRNGTLYLPNCNTSGYSVVEVCRVINQWIYGTNFSKLLSNYDCEQCRSTGKLGVNLYKLLYMENKSKLQVFKSEVYKVGNRKSFFEITCELIK